MSTQQSTVDFILEQLNGLDVSARKMFGEYALYCDGITTAFICDDTLFVKLVPANAELAAGLETGPAYPGSKDYCIVSGDKIENASWLTEIIRTTAQAVPAKKK